GYSAGADNQLRSWNAAGDAAGKQLKVVGNHGKPILKLAQHPKLPIMATCSSDGTVKTWNPETGAALKTMAEPINDEVFSVAISPDGNLGAGGAYNGVGKVGKAADGWVVKTFNASVGYQAAAPKKKKGGGPPRRCGGPPGRVRGAPDGDPGTSQNSSFPRRR